MSQHATRIIVAGPTDLDYDFVKRTLDRLTFELDDVVLVADLRPEKEYHINPSSFPMAQQWLRDKWLRNCKRGYDSHRYSTTVRHHAPYDGDKQWSKGLLEQRRTMVQDADWLVVFWDVGGVDRHTEELFRLSNFYGLEVRRILV